MGEPAPGAGTIPIALGPNGCEDHKLVPSLDACIAISSLAGGLNQAVQRCSQLNFETIVEIVAIGMGATSPATKKEVQKLCYQRGIAHIVPECIQFIRAVAHGGQLPDDEEGDEQGDRPLDGVSPSGSTTSSS